MKVINLKRFRLEEIDITKQEHLDMIKEFDNDPLVKQYLYPYKNSFYDLVCDAIKTDDIFRTFYVIYFSNKAIGYIEIESPNKTFLNLALIKSERRKGYSKLLLQELSDCLLENYSNVNSVNAIIRKDNRNSISAVESAGLIKTEEDSKFVTYSRLR